MNIQDLPNGLKELSIKRREEEQNKKKFYSDTGVGDAFDWSLTKEGFNFWYNIDAGNLNTYKAKYPNHNWIEDYPGEYQVIDGTLVVVRDYVGRESFGYGAASSIGTKLHEDVDVDSLTITPAVPLDVVYVDTSTTLTEDANLTGGSGDNYIPKVIKHYSHIGDETKEIYKDLIDKGVKMYKFPDDTGIKESDGKVDYSEINFEILDIMSARFEANKHKYPKGNMLKPIEINNLLWPIFRHWKKMMFPLVDDVETFEDHLAAILCNSSMILDQLKLKKLNK
jgi:hypothetical protein